MNCQNIESLLAAFAGGDLGETETAEVRTHVDTCDACRESLAAYKGLESALSMRRSFVPPVERFIPNIALGVTQTVANGVAAYTRARKWLDRLVSVPAIATIGFLMTGLAAFFYRDKIVSAINSQGSMQMAWPTSVETMFATWTNLMSDMLVVGSVCAIVTIIALLSTGVATARILRH